MAKEIVRGKRTGTWLVLGAGLAGAAAVCTIGVLIASSNGASAIGNGGAAGRSTVQVGDQTLDCEWLVGVSGTATDTETEDGTDARDVDSDLDGSGNCTPQSVIANFAPEQHVNQASLVRQEVLTQKIVGQLQGQVVEKDGGDKDGIFEAPATATYEISLQIETTSIGSVHTSDSEPLIVDCPNIDVYEQHSCEMPAGTTTNLYDQTGANVVATIVALKMNFAVDGRPELPPPLGSGGPIDENGTAVIWAIVIGLGVVTVIGFSGGLLAARRRAD
jgi:hypothetical protein